MGTVLEIGHRMEVCEVSVDSVDGQVVVEEDQDPSIFVDVVFDYNHSNDAEGAVMVKVFGEELRHRLEGQIFFFREAELDEEDQVRRILF
jgi:uncharacterized membrane protein